MNNDFLVQLIALFALAAFAGSFHSKTRKGILLWQILSIIIWVIHYSLLGAWTGASLIVVNGIFTTIFVYKDKKNWLKNPWILYIALSTLTLVTLLSWKGFWSIFALLAVMSGITAKWQDDTKKIKLISIVASVFWIIYDLRVGSWGGVVTEAIIILSAAGSLIRNKKYEKIP